MSASFTFQSKTSFKDDLDRRVAAYFATTGLKERGVGRMYLKTAIIVAWVAASYVGLVFFAHDWWSAVPLAISLGLAIAGVGFSIQHDATHGAYSERRFVNRLMGWSLDFVGGSSYFWRYKHNIAHHTYPNIAGADDDLVVGKLGRLCPHDPWYPHHRFQQFYMWILYGLLTIRWTLIDDFHSMIDPGVGITKVPRPRGVEQLRFWLGKLCYLSLGLALPIYLHGFAAFIVCFMITNFVLGLVLATVFQLAHCVGEAEFPLPADGRIAREWSAHQLDTTVDFAPHSRLISWYVGGLNFQVEHHLFPSICHVHYPALQKIVSQTAAEHGIKYRCNQGATTALASHFRWLRTMGQPNPQVSPASSTSEAHSQ